MKDKYGDELKDGDLVLIRTYKRGKYGQELYEYVESKKVFIPQRKVLKLGTYEMKVRELRTDEIKRCNVIRRIGD